MNRRKRAPGAGNARELAVMGVLTGEGWLVASRRHIGGAGDILAVRRFIAKSDQFGNVSDYYLTFKQVMLIEVKSTTRSPWVTFGPKDRQDLVDTALTYGAEPVLAWWPPRGKLRWIRPSEFPPNPQPEVEFPSLDEAQAEHARAVIERQDGA